MSSMAIAMNTGAAAVFPKFKRVMLWAAVMLPLLSACSTLPKGPASDGGAAPADSAPPSGRSNLDLDAIPDAIPRVEPRSRYGNPPYYEVMGRRYYVRASSENYVERGIASWYGTKFHGRRTSSGEPYNMYEMTAAHPTLPIPAYVQVTNLRNGRKVVVRVNDRGPFHDNRLIDLSYVAALKLGIVDAGTGLVEVRALNASSPAAAAEAAVSAPAPRAGSDDIYLQMGAFSDREKAERLSQRITTAAPHRKVQIQETRADGRTVFRVRLGPLPGASEVDRVAAELKNLGIKDARVVVD